MAPLETNLWIGTIIGLSRTLKQAGPGASQTCLEPQGLVHGFVAGSAADGEGGKTLFPAPLTGSIGQKARDAGPPKHGFNVKVLKNSCLTAAEGGEGGDNGAHADSSCAPFGEEEGNLLVADGLFQTFSPFLGQRFFADFRQVAVFEF